MGALLRHALIAREWPQHLALDRAARDPQEAQARVLRAVVRANRDTVFGREHGFSEIAGAADYAQRVPVRDYEALRPYVMRVIAGEPAVLTAEAPVMFTTTSGTTGEPKLIPVTPRWAAATAGLMRLWAFYALRDHPAMLGGKVLTIVSPAVEGRTPQGVPFGAMTGWSYQRLPWPIRRCQALPYAATLIRDYETRYVVAARLALAGPVSSIGTPNPSTLLRLADTASRRAEALVRAIHDGTLGVDSVEPASGAECTGADLRNALERAIRPDPERAAFLARVLEGHGRLVLGACWPELALLGCWLGGSAGIQARHLADHFEPRVARRDLGFVASEGRLTIPLEDGSAAGVLAVHANFFEFIAEEEIDAPRPSARLAHELEEGRRYYVLLTGANGLYRYDLNDIVEVRGFHHRTPKVAFVRKGRDMVSITGEKLHLNHLMAAVRAGERPTGLSVWQFRVIPDVEQARYDLLLELERPPAGPAALAQFVDAFDAALVTANVEYDAKRASGRLRPPCLHVMRRGWSERLCRHDFAQGRRENQHKWSAIRHEWDAASRDDVLLVHDPTERAETPR